MAGDALTGKSGEPEFSGSLKTFGAVLQALRENAGLSREELGRMVTLSESSVASVEQGRRMPDPEFVVEAERATGSTGVLSKAAVHLARDKPGLAHWFREWARLELKAITLYTYECRMIPGLLQTEAYARTLSDGRLPPLDDEQIEAKWAERLKRQRLLRERPNTTFSFILDEHLFLRRTGGAEVTRELIDHLLEVSSLRNVEIQIMPLKETHAGLSGPMQLLETPKHRWYAYCEGQHGGMLLSEPKVVSTLQMRYAKMRSQARTTKHSLSLLHEMRGAV